MINPLSLEPWQKRLLIEFWELEERYEQLSDFLDNSESGVKMIKPEEIARLDKQRESMLDLYEILQARVRASVVPPITP